MKQINNRKKKEVTDKPQTYITAKSGMLSFLRLKQTYKRNSQRNTNNWKNSLRKRGNKQKQKYKAMLRESE